MSIFLRDIPLPEAQHRLVEALEAAGLAGLLGVEEIDLDQHAAGRVLAEAVFARISSPHYHAAAMDGFALRSVDTVGALPAAPRSMRVVDESLPNQAWEDCGTPAAGAGGNDLAG